MRHLPSVVSVDSSPRASNRQPTLPHEHFRGSVAPKGDAAVCTVRRRIYSRGKVRFADSRSCSNSADARSCSDPAGSRPCWGRRRKVVLRCCRHGVVLRCCRRKVVRKFCRHKVVLMGPVRSPPLTPTPPQKKKARLPSFSRTLCLPLRTGHLPPMSHHTHELSSHADSHHPTTHITRDKDGRVTRSSRRWDLNSRQKGTQTHRSRSNSQLATRNSQLDNHSATRAHCARCARTRLVYIRESCMGSGGGTGERIPEAARRTRAGQVGG